MDIFFFTALSSTDLQWKKISVSIIHLWRKRRHREKVFLPQLGGKGSTYMF